MIESSEENGIIRCSIPYVWKYLVDLDAERFLDHAQSCWKYTFHTHLFISENAKAIIRSRLGLIKDGAVNIAILRGGLFDNQNRNNPSIREFAAKHNLRSLSIADACIISSYLDNIKRLGLWSVVLMHEPEQISGYDGDLVLAIDRNDGDRGHGRRLVTYDAGPEHTYPDSYPCGFAFLFS